MYGGLYIAHIIPRRCETFKCQDRSSAAQEGWPMEDDIQILIIVELHQGGQPEFLRRVTEFLQLRGRQDCGDKEHCIGAGAIADERDTIGLCQPD